MSCSEANPPASGKKRGVLVEIGVGSFFAPAAPNSTERVTATALKGGFGGLWKPWKPYLEAFWLPPKYCRAGHLSPLDFLKAGLLHLTDGSTSDPCYFAKFPRREKSAESKNNEESACAAGQLRSIKRYAEQEPEGTGPRGEAKNETEKKSSDIATSKQPQWSL